MGRRISRDRAMAEAPPRSCLTQRRAGLEAHGWGGGTTHHDAVIRNTDSHMEPLEPCCKIVDTSDSLTSRLFFLPWAPSRAPCSTATAIAPITLLSCRIRVASRGVDLLKTWRGSR